MSYKRLKISRFLTHPDGDGAIASPSLDDKMLRFSINKRLLTKRQFTKNISTRGILLRLESTEICFRPGSAPNPVGAAHDAPPTS